MPALIKKVYSLLVSTGAVIIATSYFVTDIVIGINYFFVINTRRCQVIFLFVNHHYFTLGRQLVWQSPLRWCLIRSYIWCCIRCILLLILVNCINYTISTNHHIGKDSLSNGTYNFKIRLSTKKEELDPYEKKKGTQHL